MHEVRKTAYKSLTSEAIELGFGLLVIRKNTRGRFSVLTGARYLCYTWCG